MPNAVQVDALLPLVLKLKLDRIAVDFEGYDAALDVFCGLHRAAGYVDAEPGRDGTQHRLLVNRLRPEDVLQEVAGLLGVRNRGHHYDTDQRKREQISSTPRSSIHCVTRRHTSRRPLAVSASTVARKQKIDRGPVDTKVGLALKAFQNVWKVGRKILLVSAPKDLLNQYQVVDGGSIGDDDHASGHRADAPVRLEILFEFLDGIGRSRLLPFEKRLNFAAGLKAQQALDLGLRQRFFVVSFYGQALQNVPRQIAPPAGERLRYIVR